MWSGAKICAVLGVALGCVAAAAVGTPADEIPVKYPEGTTHGFLLVRAPDGKELGAGDLIEVGEGDHMSVRLTFHFKDGSVYDETTKFSQRGKFRLISDHLVEKGPSFPQAIDAMVDAAQGRVAVKYIDKGKEKTANKQMQIPADAANGLVTILARNIASKSLPQTVSMVATSPKPRLVQLIITPEGSESVPFGNLKRKAVRYRVKVHVGGVVGAVAKIAGKIPPDSFIWMTDGEAPAFLEAQEPLQGGPVCTIELTVPAMPRSSVASASSASSLSSTPVTSVSGTSTSASSTSISSTSSSTSGDRGHDGH